MDCFLNQKSLVMSFVLKLPKNKWLDMIEDNMRAVGVCVRDVENRDKSGRQKKKWKKDERKNKNKRYLVKINKVVNI